MTTIITKEWVAAHLPSRMADSHKGTYGTLLTVCGSYVLYTILNAEDTAAAHNAFESALKGE